MTILKGTHPLHLSFVPPTAVIFLLHLIRLSLLMCNFFSKFGPPRQILAPLSENIRSVVVLLLDPGVCIDTVAGILVVMSVVAAVY